MRLPLPLVLTSLAALSLSLTGCMSLKQDGRSMVPTTTSLAYFPKKTQTQNLLNQLPPPQRPVAIAVYGFTDQTGQFKQVTNGQTLSRAVTQGASAMLVKALQETGNRNWFTVVERERLDNLLKERQIISEMRKRYLGEQEVDPNALPALLFAGVLLEGGIVGYDTNTVTGGAGASFLGIGAKTDLLLVQDGTGNTAALLQSESDAAAQPQIATAAAGDAVPTLQIAPRAQPSGTMAQLTRADLDATLAQLSLAERRVLFQAIVGSDICDKPPDVAAIVALCRDRLETRAGDFAPPPQATLTAEERLLGGNLDEGTLPSLERVIARLARGGATGSADPSNHAIAAIALGTGLAPAAPDKAKPGGPQLGEETQALVNALVTQLGGTPPAGGGSGQ